MRKRYKLILIIFISFILVIFIYYIFNNKKVIYVAFGDSLNSNKLSTSNYADYINDHYKDQKVKYYNFLDQNIKIDTLIENIENGSKGISYLLKSAKLITLCLNMNELDNYIDLSKEIYETYIKKINILLTLLKKLNSNIHIIIVPKEGYSNIVEGIKLVCKKKNINYVDLLTLGSSNIFIIENSVLLNSSGHKMLSELIVN